MVGPPPGDTQPASGVAEAHSTAEPLTAPLLRGVRGSPAPRKPTVQRQAGSRLPRGRSDSASRQVRGLRDACEHLEVVIGYEVAQPGSRFSPWPARAVREGLSMPLPMVRCRQFTPRALGQGPRARLRTAQATSPPPRRTVRGYVPFDTSSRGSPAVLAPHQQARATCRTGLVARPESCEWPPLRHHGSVVPAQAARLGPAQALARVRGRRRLHRSSPRHVGGRRTASRPRPPQRRQALQPSLRSPPRRERAPPCGLPRPLVPQRMLPPWQLPSVRL